MTKIKMLSTQKARLSACTSGVDTLNKGAIYKVSEELAKILVSNSFAIYIEENEQKSLNLDLENKALRVEENKASSEDIDRLFAKEDWEKLRNLGEKKGVKDVDTYKNKVCFLKALKKAMGFAV